MCDKRPLMEDRKVSTTGEGKKPKSPTSLNQKYKSNSFKNTLKINYGTKQPTDIYSPYPFKHLVLPDFIDDAEFLDNLQQELSDLSFLEKNNDLYKFRQSKDLKNSTSPYIESLRNLMYDDFRQWLIDVIEIPLNDKVTMSCSKYDYTDILLCHDDELEQRRIAFILYFVPEWSEKDGGSLDLFDKDESDRPKNVVKSIFPKRNNLVFFEVSAISYHQVAEVLSETKTRLSVSGWFFGPSLKRPDPYKEPLQLLQDNISIEEDMLYEWINPIYLSPEVQSDIKEKFESESEIQLQDFLQVEKFNSLKKLFESGEVRWLKTGPANKRWYYRSDGNLPEILNDCLTFLHSDALFLILSNMTGLRLHSLAPDSENDTSVENMSNEASGSKPDSSQSDNPVSAKCYSEVRKWNHGCYTLVHDCDTGQAEFALDSMLFFGCDDWDSSYGGFTSYIARDENEELLTVEPTENSLALVYRDKETLKFIKYLNHKINNMKHGGFYDIYTVYYE